MSLSDVLHRPPDAHTLQLWLKKVPYAAFLGIRAELDDDLAGIRSRGWALSDETLSVGIRSIAAPVRDTSGRIAAAANVTVHAAETSIERLTGEYLPHLLTTTAAITSAWADMALLPVASADEGIEA